MEIEHQTDIDDICIWNSILELSVDMSDSRLGSHYDWWVGTVASKLLFSH